MGKYSWNEFVDSEYCKELLAAFNVIEEEINGVDNEVVVFISRRSFCLFLLLRKKGFLESWDRYEIYSDRKIIKNTDRTFLDGKNVILIDDTIYSGAHMKECIDMIRSHVQINCVHPFVLVSDKGKKWKENGALETVKCFRSYSESQMLELASIETLLFYQEGIPYVAELPVLTELEASGNEFEIVLSNDEFFELTHKNSKWEYQEYRQLGYQQNEVISGIIILKDHILKRCMPELIYNMTVRMQWIEKKDGIHLVMIPFAILKSIYFDDLYDAFVRLFDGTDYKREIDNSLMESDFRERSYIAIYRAVVYALSYYIADEIRVFCYKTINRKFKVNVTNNDYYYSEVFVDSIKKIFNLQCGYNNILQLINWSAQKEVGYREYILDFGKKYMQRRYTNNRAYLFLLELMNDKHHEVVIATQEGSSLQDEVITIEEISYLIETYLLRDCENEVDVEGYLCGLICSMLNQGNLVNELKYDSGSGIVYRGFHAGENSDAFYDFSAKIFCAAVLKYKECVGEKYSEWYAKFVVYLYKFCDMYDLWKNYINQDEFLFYAKYFEMAGEATFMYQIENKKFLVKDNLPYYLKIVQEYIGSIDFQKR